MNRDLFLFLSFYPTHSYSCTDIICSLSITHIDTYTLIRTHSQSVFLSHIYTINFDTKKTSRSITKLVLFDSAIIGAYVKG